MTTAPIKLILALALAGAGVMRAAPPAASLGRASQFSSVEYFEAPHAQQMKTRLSGAEATPVPNADGLIVVTQLQIERFAEDGRLVMIINAPDCIYDTMNSTASSPGPLQLRTGDGRMTTTGDGFLWRQNVSSLTISNNVRTVIEAPAGKIAVP